MAAAPASPAARRRSTDRKHQAKGAPTKPLEENDEMQNDAWIEKPLTAQEPRKLAEDAATDEPPEPAAATKKAGETDAAIQKVVNTDADWPEPHQGFAKRARGYFDHHLRPVDRPLKAPILEYPHNDLGDAGLFLCW